MPATLKRAHIRFEAVAPLFDAVFLNEKGREAAWAARAIQVQRYHLRFGVYGGVDIFICADA